MKSVSIAVSLLFFGVITNSTILHAAPMCNSPSSDADGDGWGWENNDSCVVSTTTCIDNDGDGYGWDGMTSCVVKPSVTECIDADGDGYGWNGQSTCLVTAQPTLCIDTDGDGWGWDGTDSCEVVTAESPEDPAPTEEPDAPVCIDTEPMNDTWGWNGIGTCRIAPVLAEQDTSAIAGLWDASDEDGTYYINIGENGFYTAYESLAPDQDCFLLEDINAMPESYGAQFVPLGGDLYEYYYYEFYNGFLDTDRTQYEIRITENNALSISFLDMYDDDNDGDTSDYITDVLLAATGIDVNELIICD